MITFMTEDHPDAFVDFPDIQLPDGVTVCNRCRGYGGWNLQLNAYQLRDLANTRENRHRYAHFRASCTSCWGWGYIIYRCSKPGKYIGHYFDFHWTCRQCGVHVEVDSSG